MRLNDKIECEGRFVIKSYKEDGTFDVYEEKNLIMDEARKTMAYLLGGVTTDPSYGDPVNKFVIGTKGHIGNDILNPKQPGEDGFDTTRTALFSEEDPTAYNYAIEFNPEGSDSIQVDGTGKMYQGTTLVETDAAPNPVSRVVSERTVTYTITIPTTNGNHPTADAIAYTEAALYSSTKIFSMKCFNGRIKEDTVKLVIEWSILF